MQPVQDFVEHHSLQLLWDFLAKPTTPLIFFSIIVTLFTYGLINTLLGTQQVKSAFKKALSYISSAVPIDPRTIVLLDLNMPVMTGWEFLEKFELLNIECLVFIVTSSLNQADKERVSKYPIVSGYFIKPISDKDIKFILKM